MDKTVANKQTHWIRKYFLYLVAMVTIEYLTIRLLVTHNILMVKMLLISKLQLDTQIFSIITCRHFFLDFTDQMLILKDF